MVEAADTAMQLREWGVGGAIGIAIVALIISWRHESKCDKRWDTLWVEMRHNTKLLNRMAGKMGVVDDD